MLEPSRTFSAARVDARCASAPHAFERTSAFARSPIWPIAVRVVPCTPQSPIAYARAASLDSCGTYAHAEAHRVRSQLDAVAGLAGLWVQAGVSCDAAAARTGIVDRIARVALEWRAVYGAAGQAIRLGGNWVDVARMYGITQEATLVGLQILSVFVHVTPTLVWGGEWREVARWHGISSPYALGVLQDAVANRYAYPHVDAHQPWHSVATAFDLDAPDVRRALQHRSIGHRAPGLLALGLTCDVAAEILGLDPVGRADLEMLARRIEAHTVLAYARAGGAASLGAPASDSRFGPEWQAATAATAAYAWPAYPLLPGMSLR
ncbi:protein of unknown function [Pararobbsia alpina]